MIVEGQTIPAAGINYVYEAGMAFAFVVMVFVEGLQYDVSITSTGNRLCWYKQDEGRIYFQNNFDGLQKVEYVYKVPTMGGI